MFSAQLDKSLCLLRLSFAQHVNRDEAAACFEQASSLVGQAEKGFCLLTDLSQLQSMDLACAPYIDRLMDACNRAGVRQVIRIVPDPRRDIGFGIMSLFHYGKNVRTITCGSMAEAESFLPTCQTRTP
jgi:hypothetical protein